MDLKKVAAPILKGSLKGQKAAASILKGSQKAAAPILKEISKSGRLQFYHSQSEMCRAVTLQSV